MNRNKPKSVCKPDPVRPGLATRPDDHSSRPAVADGLKRPTRPACPSGHESGPLSSRPPLKERRPGGGTYLALLRVGFAKPTCRHVAGALLPRHFTLTHVAFRLIVRRGRCIFCGTFREVTLPGRYPAPCPAESGLSSRPDLAEVETGGHPTDFGHYHRNAHRHDLQPQNSDGYLPDEIASRSVH
jgi:hypothetical protein